MTPKGSVPPPAARRPPPAAGFIAPRPSPLTPRSFFDAMSEPVQSPTSVSPAGPVDRQTVVTDLPASLYVGPDGREQRNASLSEINRVIAGNLDGHLWVDIDVTNRHHVALLENVCRFHPLTV